MVGTDTVKKELVGQFIGHSLHLFAKYMDVQYAQAVQDKAAKGAEKLTDVEAKFLEGLDKAPLLKRWTFLMDAIGGTVLTVNALKGYGSDGTKGLCAIAGANLLINLEDPILNVAMKGAYGEDAKVPAPGYAIPQHFRVSEVPLVATPQSARMAVPNTAELRGM